MKDKETADLSAEDRKAMETYLNLKGHWRDDEVIDAASWGIRYARANDDPGPEWVASNILDGAAKRIAELEAEIAKHTIINSLLAGDEPEIALANKVFQQVGRIAELEAEVLRWRDKFTNNCQILTGLNTERMNDIIALQSKIQKIREFISIAQWHNVDDYRECLSIIERGSS